MASNLVIVDYGMGNVHSVFKKINRLNVNCMLSSNPEDILRADKLILPGVGHFGMAMEHLKTNHILESLTEAVMQKKTPILGICLGMQLMAKHSEEGNVDGLGWFDSKVVRFNIKDTLHYKIPHTGWNQVTIAKQSPLMRDIMPQSEFYFVHSYHMVTSQLQDVLNETEYEYSFVSGVEKENIFGVQYHPEKSHDTGEQLLKNFLAI